MTSIHRIFSWIVFALLLSSTSLFSQSQSPVVRDLQVTYKIQSVPDSIPLVKPQAEISLSTSSAVQKVYFKILDQANAVIYDVNYNINTSPVVASGLTLFAINGNTISIKSPNTIPLASYTYSIVTEDAQGNQTIPFIKIQ